MGVGVGNPKYHKTPAYRAAVERAQDTGQREGVMNRVGSDCRYCTFPATRTGIMKWASSSGGKLTDSQNEG
jgi:hypothetical protein